MDKERAKKLKEELNESFTDEYIYNAGTLIHKFAEQFYNENNLKGKIYFNEDIFNYCLIDILVDLARLKHFHDISRVNYCVYCLVDFKEKTLSDFGRLHGRLHIYQRKVCLDFAFTSRQLL